MKRQLAVVAGMTVVGVLAGGLWAAIAPPIQSAARVNASGRHAHQYLGQEADHYFDAAVMMAGLLIAVGLVGAVLVWQWRARRGAVMVVALTVGGVGAAAAAAGVGAGLVRLRYGHQSIDGIPDDRRIHYLTEAPAVFFGHTPLQVITTLLLPAAVAAVAYGMLAAASSRDDLGAGTVPSVPEAVA